MTFRDALTNSPLLAPIAFDPVRDIIQFAELSEDDYRACSFLDSRSFQNARHLPMARWSEVRTLGKSLPRRCDFIFHISHCGSTLISRLLGRLPGILSLREPGPLRSLVDYPDEIAGFLGYYSRTFHPEQRALLKASSIVSAAAGQLMAAVPDSRAILLHIPLESFLPALLGGAYTDIEVHAEARWRRFCNMASHPRRPESRGEWTAITWLTETLTLARLKPQFPTRCLSVDFEAFLAEPRGWLTAMATHLHRDASVRAIDAALAGPDMSHYAKNPAQSYDASLRTRLLRRAAAEAAAEIDRGRDWALTTLAQEPGLGELLKTWHNDEAGHVADRA